jgi:hypothetical protein
MGSWVGVEQYHCMSSLDSGRKPVDGIVRAVFWKDRGRFNISYKLIRINAHKIVRATFGKDSGGANRLYGQAVGSIEYDDITAWDY